MARKMDLKVHLELLVSNPAVQPFEDGPGIFETLGNSKQLRINPQIPTVPWYRLYSPNLENMEERVLWCFRWHNGLCTWMNLLLRMALNSKEYPTSL